MLKRMKVQLQLHLNNYFLDIFNFVTLSMNSPLV